MAITIEPGFRLHGRIRGLLHARPMMAVELAARLDYSYQAIKDALAEMVKDEELRRIGQRYALADSEADGGPMPAA